MDGHIAESQVDKEAPVDLTSPAGWSQEGPVSRATRNLQVQVSKLEPSKRGGRRAKMADKPKPKKRAEPVCLDDSDFGGRRAKMADKPKPKKRAEPVCLDDRSRAAGCRPMPRSLPKTCMRKRTSLETASAFPRTPCWRCRCPLRCLFLSPQADSTRGMLVEGSGWN